MTNKNNIFHKDFKIMPYWWEKHPPTVIKDRVPPKQDISIVGGGYCGLTAGLLLLRHGYSVSVFDSGPIGAGASTRNGGMVSGGMKIPMNLEKKLGKKRFNALMEESVESFYFLENFIKEESLQASYHRCGRFNAAHSKGAYQRLAQQLEFFQNTVNIHARMVPKAKQHTEIGSNFYHGGMVVKESGSLNPAEFHASLLNSYINAGGSVHAETKVKKIERTNGKFKIFTEENTQQAKKVFIATNGYSQSLWPYLQRRIIPITTFVIATEELPLELTKELNPNNRMLVDTKRILYWYRLTPDKRRIIFGGRARFRDTNEKESAKSLYKFMTDIWPQVKGTKITHAWKGNVGFTFDKLPHMGVKNGIYYAGGFQGTGVAMAPYLGWQSALKMLNKVERKSAFDSLNFPTNPLYYGKPWFIPIVGNYYRTLDLFERYTGK